ncbi:MAG: hypothetical protein ACI4XE_04805 [Acutalibacteraceae bacterium]
MKKHFLLLTAVILFAFSLSLCASAYNDFETDFSSETQDSLFSSIDDETEKILSQFGINDFSSAYDASFSDIVSYFSTNIKEKANDAVRCFFSLFIVTLLIAVIKAVVIDGESSDAFELLTIAVSSVISINFLYPVIQSIVSVLNVSGNFIKAYIPIFAGIIAASGKPASALTYNTLVLAMAEILSAVCSDYAIHIVGAFIAVSIGFSLGNSISADRISHLFNKATSLVFGFSAGTFASVLTLKGSLSAAVDSTSVKSIRYLISSMIPVVGSSISEAYSSILGSIGLIKGSAAIIGVVSILIINIPALAQGLLYYAAMNILSICGIALDCKKLSGFYGCLSCAMKFLLILTVFEIFLLVISTGLLLSFKD